MCPRLRPLARYLLVLLVIGFGAAPELKAAFVNGSFNNGLSDWTPSDLNYVQVNGGAVTLSEPLLDAEVTLAQQFLIDTDATVLSFRILALENGANLSGFIPDAFGVSLLDPTTFQPLTATALGEPDAYYIRDLVDGVTSGEAAPGVSVVDLGGGQYRIEIGVSDLRGMEGLLRFRLIGGGDSPEDASITITDVALAREGGGGGNPPANAVPGPAGFALCLSGLPLLVVFRRFVR